VPHGPGHTGIEGPVKRCVELGYEGLSVTVCAAAPPPLLDFARPPAPADGGGGGGSGSGGGGGAAAAEVEAARAAQAAAEATSAAAETAQAAAQAAQAAAQADAAEARRKQEAADAEVARMMAEMQRMELERAAAPQHAQQAAQALFTRAGAKVTLSAGDTVATRTSEGQGFWTNAVAVLGEDLAVGVHCWELQLTKGNDAMVGVCKASVDVANTNDLNTGSDAWFMFTYNGVLHGNGQRNGDQAGAFTEGDRVGFRLDLGAGTLSFFKNGVPHGPGHTGIEGPVKRCVELGYEGLSVTVCECVSFQG